MNATQTLAPRHDTRLRPRYRVVLLASFAALALTLPTMRTAAAQPVGQQPPPTVHVMRVERQSISRAEEFIGRVEAVGKVDVRARVTGFLQRRHFEEGQDVKEGDLLFTLGQAPFAAEIALRGAEVARGEANLRNASLQVERGREDSATADTLEAIVDLDLTPLADIEPSRGYGWD